jgi:oligo-1,6-glucosidase
LENHESIFAYTRTLGNEKLLVINNFFEKETFFMLPEHIDYLSKELLISNYIMEPDQDIYNISLRPYELLAIKLFV